LPPFRREGLFPEGVLFRAERASGRVVVRRLAARGRARPDL
jgi:hypothetical protein